MPLYARFFSGDDLMLRFASWRTRTVSDARYRFILRCHNLLRGARWLNLGCRFKFGIPFSPLSPSRRHNLLRCRLRLPAPELAGANASFPNHFHQWFSSWHNRLRAPLDALPVVGTPLARKLFLQPSPIEPHSPHARWLNFSFARSPRRARLGTPPPGLCSGATGQGGSFSKEMCLEGHRGIMAGEMLHKPTPGRLLTALRIALYPAFESAEARGFQALTMEAENARGSGDLARAEVLYSTAAAEARSSSDPSYLSRARDGLARVYQEQRRYREAERIFGGQLEEAVNFPEPSTLVHAGHMSLALLYQDEGKFAEAETHYKAALAETEKTELFPGRGFWCSTSMWLARFYVARQRYSDAEPLFQRALEFHEEDRGPTSYLPHHLQEFAKLYEAQGKYETAEALYRRALEVCEQLHGANGLFTLAGA